ncbi:MAG: TIGR03557 family F420-dependent LLM class oxidoreductase [Geodermatophilaceae bacterium]|nr:TIGR03557 family F420-dependent LLM class oxidoreductase [Geodermatophilaceae bacterium]
MTRFGYTLMTEQSGPQALVGYAAAAEQAGFDFLVSSDHYFPWLDSMGHAPYAWSILGAATQVTERVELLTYVTCPTMRYHPAVVAQKAATLGLLSNGRFTLGLGSGENLNEHVIGQGWPTVAVRQEMLEEAITIIRRLLDGDQLTVEGDYFRVDQARLWDRPEQPVQIGVAVGGAEAVRRFAPLGDHLIATEPSAHLISGWNDARDGDGLSTSRAIGQIPICWGPDKNAAIDRAHELFRWFGGGWQVNADLPMPAGFEGASQFVRPEDVGSSIACGPDLDELAESLRPFWEAGFTDVALVQIGNESQDRFLDEIAPELLDKLRASAPSD